MENNGERFRYLFNKYTTGNCAENERDEFLEMVTHKAYAHVLKELIQHEVDMNAASREMNADKADEIFKSIVRIANTAEKVGDENQPVAIPVARNYRVIWWAAAAIFIMLTSGAYLLFKQDDTKQIAKNKVITAPAAPDIAPGHSGAILSLANGKKIILDSAHNGVLASEGSTDILKENGLISYNNQSAENEVVYNTMTTPKGRQYQLVLADGSQVWLNAASSITFPTAFNGKERKVSVTGEVYFEVKHLTTATNAAGRGKRVPFIVTVEAASGTKSEIEVLGTHFNVMSYGNEPAIKTTLLEGSVKLVTNNSSVTIKPGEQAVIDKQSDKLSVANVDVDETVAWKNGLFSFKKASIETVMHQVERWYDVDVVYAGAKPAGHYKGEIPMNVHASEMLKVLEVSGIHFKLEGKTITVEK